MCLLTLLGLAYIAERIQEELELCTMMVTWISCSALERGLIYTLSKFHNIQKPPAYLIVSVWIAPSKGSLLVIS